MKRQIIKKGDVFYVDLNFENYNIQSGNRPYVVVQNNIGNKYSPNLLMIPVSSKIQKQNFLTHILLKSKIFKYQSFALCENIITVSKKQLIDYVGHLNKSDIEEINNGLLIELGITCGLKKI